MKSACPTQMKTCFCLFALALLAGCGKAPTPGLNDQFFVDWLKNHGETNVVTDASGVGLAGNKTRYRASLYGSESSKTGCSVEVEYRITLPEGGPIIEYVSGIGDTKDKAVSQAMVNFTLTTAHVIYKAFINPADPHQREKTVTMNGQKRELFAGDMIQLGGGTNGSIDLDDMSAQCQDMVAALPLGPGTHWIKLVYSQDHNKPMIVAASLDNKDNAAATDALTKLKWPAREDFYMAKQFYVIK